MKSSAIKYCTSCGEKVKDYSEKCICGNYPEGLKNDILTEQESGLTFEQQKFLNSQYCINCGNSNEGLEGKYNELICTKCGKNPCGIGKEFRDEITINYCENCGKKVQDRDTVCSCGRLPYQSDNNETYNPDNKNIEDFTDKDWDLESELSKIKYCKECGFNHNNDNKYDEVDMDTGEVYYDCPQCK